MYQLTGLLSQETQSDHPLLKDRPRNYTGMHYSLLEVIAMNKLQTPTKSCLFMVITSKQAIMHACPFLPACLPAEVGVWTQANQLTQLEFLGAVVT